MNKNSVKKLIFIILILGCTAFIFSNSMKNGEESKMDSDFFMRIAEAIFGKILPNNQVDWNFVVRKAAHLFEFCMLGISAVLLAIQIDKNRVITFGCAFLYAVLIAFADEFIQSFTGRSSKFTDVMIDITGAILGIAFVLLVDLIVSKRKNKS